jgi:hypothetical protein
MSLSQEECTPIEEVMDVLLDILMKAKEYDLISRCHLIEHDIEEDTKCFVKFLKVLAPMSKILLETIDLLQDPKLVWKAEDDDTVQLIEKTVRSKMRHPTALFAAFWENLSSSENGVSQSEKLSFLSALMECCDLLPIEE